MRSFLKTVAGLCLLGAMFASTGAPARADDLSAATPVRSIASIPRPQGVPSMTLARPGNRFAHAFPAAHRSAQIVGAAADAGPLVYNGGPVMSPNVMVYNIFWLPPKLQSGAATSVPANFTAVLNALAANYANHGLADNNTQYYAIAPGTTAKTYIKAIGGRGGYYLDTAAYPASGCADSLTPGNCLTDAQLQAEIRRVMTLEGWTPGVNKIYMMYTSVGEGSCFDSSSTTCAYNYYCAYHSAFGTTAAPVIYANEPWGNPSYCFGAGQSPNGNAGVDATATSSSHEITEAVTDPFGNAWFTAAGNEIGDLCAYNYGTNSWDSGKANQMWNGSYFELQTEFDNHVTGCVQLGP